MRQGRWTFLNRAWQVLTGYAVHDSLGQPFEACVHPDDRAAAQQMCGDLLAGRTEEATRNCDS